MNSLRKKVLSLFLIFSLLVGIVYIANVDTTYAASKKIHLNKSTGIDRLLRQTFNYSLRDLRFTNL